MKQKELRKLKVGENFYLPNKPSYQLESHVIITKKEGMVTCFSELTGQMYFFSGEILVLTKEKEAQNEEKKSI